MPKQQAAGSQQRPTRAATQQKPMAETEALPINPNPNPRNMFAKPC